jgi:hypothetical protein
MLHPWYTSRPPKLEIKSEENPFESTAFEQGYPEDYQFEKDLLDTLALLGFNDYAALTTALRGKGKNAEKAFYQLLHKRKYEMLETYNQEEVKYDQEGGPTRRADSFTSEGSRSPNHQSAESLPSPTDSNPNVNSASTNNAAKKSVVNRKPTQVKHNSPLGAETKALMPVHGEEVVEAQGAESEIYLILGQRSKPKVKKSLAINTVEVKKDENTPKSAVLVALNNFTVSTPKHRKGQLLQDVLPQSPIISNTPKVSWFQGLFNFKPETYYLLSNMDLAGTTRILNEIFRVCRDS